MPNYQLHNLSENDFERLVYHLCLEILGIGTVAFAEGPDGGRDGRFEGRAERYPSSPAPWEGKFILQAKHTTNPVARCSDGEFWKNKTSVLEKEKPKMKRLRQAGEVDNYLLFTNRRLGGEADAKIVRELKEHTGISNIALIGTETLSGLLNTCPAVVRYVGIELFGAPIRFHSEDVKNLILAFQSSEHTEELEDLGDLEYTSMEHKNEINNLRREDFDFIAANSEPYFTQIRDFLGDPINEDIAIVYRDVAAEINHKTNLRREDFAHFGEVFNFLYDRITSDEPKLRPRELIWVFLHFMYVHCDIGRK